MGGLDVRTIGQDALAAVQRMSGAQRATLGMAFVATALGIFLVAKTTAGTPMSTLFGGLEPETAADVTAELDAQGVPYELLNGGQVIQVPSDQVHSLRLAMAAKDLPGSNAGWGVLDAQGITTSVFQQEVGFQRAMEGELARTISVIDGVASANVHLAIPSEDLLAADDKFASASVLIVTSGPNSVTPMQVDAIVNLVSSSIEGLAPDQIAVTDQAGNVLAAPGGGSGVVGLEGATQLNAQQQFERNLETELENVLAAIVGPGHAIVTVTAELDFDSQVTTSEEHTPILSEAGEQLIAADTTRDEDYSGAGTLTDDEGTLEIEEPVVVPEDEAGEADGGINYSLDEADTVYIVDKVITNAQTSAGTVESLSVAVLLDEAALDAGAAADVESHIQAAAGLRDARGDTLAVTLLPFSEQTLASIEASNAAALEATTAAEAAGGLDLIGLIRAIGTVVVVLVVIMLGLRMSKGPKRKVIESVEVSAVESGKADAAGELEAGEADEDEEGEEETETEPASVVDEAAEPAEPPEIALQSLIANQTEDVAGVLRTWLNEAEEVGAR